MASEQRSPRKNSGPRRPRATTPEGREKQLIAKAVDLAERQIDAGTASAQVISHYLKLGSTREQLEQERLRKENALLEAKKEQMAAGARVEELYGAAIDAMRAYAGQTPRRQDDSHDD